MSRRPMELGRPASGKRKLKDLLLQRDNRTCADCGAADPKWASSNIGVFICLKCCGVHRSLGTHISKVLSVTLDEWSDDEIEAMTEVGGNSSANSIYEAYIPEGYSKPGPDAGHEERSKFIRSKYELQEFLKPSLRINSANKKPQETSKISVQASFSKKIMDSFRINSSKTSTISSMILLGIFVWTFLEYVMHRFLFHMNTTSYWGNTLHYFLHGYHHKHPMDEFRLVFPPAITAIFRLLFWNIMKLLASPSVAPALFGGGLLGYVAYDVTHYYLHYGRPSKRYTQGLKRYHLNHHLRVPSKGFGVTSVVWDIVFRTMPSRKAAEKKSSRAHCCSKYC